MRGGSSGLDGWRRCGAECGGGEAWRLTCRRRVVCPLLAPPCTPQRASIVRRAGGALLRSGSQHRRFPLADGCDRPLAVLVRAETEHCWKLSWEEALAAHFVVFYVSHAFGTALVARQISPPSRLSRLPALRMHAHSSQNAMTNCTGPSAPRWLSTGFPPSRAPRRGEAQTWRHSLLDSDHSPKQSLVPSMYRPFYQP